MRWFRVAVAAAIAVTLSGPGAAGQDAPPKPNPEQVKAELAALRKNKPLPIIPAMGTDDSSGETLLQVDNTSTFDLLVLLSGPTVERIQVAAGHMQTFQVKPGEYEIGVTVMGSKKMPSFYGKQTVTEKLLFRHILVIPFV